jgi:chromate reductase
VLVFGLSGSLRSGSYNTTLLRAAGRLLPPPAHLEIYTDLAAVPPYSEDFDLDTTHPAVEQLRHAIASADALLIATPEYNASIPGHLKNALDWVSRPFPNNVLRRKPVAVIGASTGLFGAVWAQAEVRKVLRTLGATVLDAELAVPAAHAAFTDDGRLRDAGLAAALQTIVDELRHQPATRAA